MNDRRIVFRDGALGVSVTIDEMNAMLQQHGLHIAPLLAPAPPQQTEAERLVEIAKGLPEEVWVGSGWGCPYLTQAGIPRFWGEFQSVLCEPPSISATTAILLGVMAAYVGTEVGAYVQCGNAGSHHRSAWVKNGNAPDLLTAYAACCKAIAERRKGGA